MSHCNSRATGVAFLAGSTARRIVGSEAAGSGNCAAIEGYGRGIGTGHAVTSRVDNVEQLRVRDKILPKITI